jgi:hypothetical protein
MDPHTELFAQYVKRVFGSAARLSGSIGTVDRPGEIQIVFDDGVIAAGRTFEETLRRVPNGRPRAKPPPFDCGQAGKRGGIPAACRHSLATANGRTCRADATRTPPADQYEWFKLLRRRNRQTK